MNRRDVLGAATIVGSVAFLTPAFAAADVEADTVAVRALLQEYVAAWAAGDAARMFAPATDDIHWVNVVGMHWQGKRDVERAHQVYLTTIFRGVPVALEEIESIVPIGAETLAVVARLSVGAFSAPGGFKNPASKNRMSLILLRAPTGLRIAHVANIEIVAAAAANDPIRRSPAAEGEALLQGAPGHGEAPRGSASLLGSPLTLTRSSPKAPMNRPRSARRNRTRLPSSAAPTAAHLSETREEWK